VAVVRFRRSEQKPAVWTVEAIGLPHPDNLVPGYPVGKYIGTRVPANNGSVFCFLRRCLYYMVRLESTSRPSFLRTPLVEGCRTDDLMPNVPISCLPPSRVDPEVQGLKVIIDCPQPGSFLATYRPPPISRWSKCGGNDTVMVFLGSGTSKMPKETQPE